MVKVTTSIKIDNEKRELAKRRGIILTDLLDQALDMALGLELKESTQLQQEKEDLLQAKELLLKEKEDFLKYLDLSDAEKADFIFNKICKKYNFDSNFIKRYRPQLKRLSSQYGGAILDGYYAVTLSSVEDERHLIVKDIIGPLIVYIPDPIERKGVFVKKVDLGKLLSKENSVITDALTDVDSKIEEIEEYPDDFEENGV